MSSRRTLILIAAVLVGAFAAFVLFAALGGNREDEREIRHVGGLTCVYNITDDVMEACK